MTISSQIKKIENLINLWTIKNLHHEFTDIELQSYFGIGSHELFQKRILDNEKLYNAWIYIKDNDEYFKLVDLSYHQFHAIYEHIKDHLGFEENDLLCDVEEVFDWRGL
jgi:hypothetical protein